MLPTCSLTSPPPLNTSLTAAQMDHDAQEVKYMLYTVHAYITIALLPFIIFLDVLIITAILTFKKFHNVHHTLVLGQVSTDVMYAVFIPLFVLSQDNTWGHLHERYACATLWAIFTSLQHTGLYFYVFITLDMFMAVTCPFWYIENVTSRKYGTICVVAVFVGSFVSGGIFIPFEYQNDECSYYSVLPRPYLIFLYVEFIIVPIVPLVMNIYIFKTSRKFMACGSLQWRHTWTREKRRSSDERSRAMKLSVLMYMVFLVCWVPVNIFSPVNEVYDHIHHIRITESVFWIWYSTYPMFNAIVIVSLKKRLRWSFRLILTTPPWRWRELRNDMDSMRPSQQRSTRTSRRSTTQPASPEVPCVSCTSKVDVLCLSRTSFRNSKKTKKGAAKRSYSCPPPSCGCGSSRPSSSTELGLREQWRRSMSDVDRVSYPSKAGTSFEEANRHCQRGFDVCFDKLEEGFSATSGASDSFLKSLLVALSVRTMPNSV